jgi:hypothetical protein
MGEITSALFWGGKSDILLDDYRALVGPSFRRGQCESGQVRTVTSSGLRQSLRDFGFLN